MPIVDIKLVAPREQSLPEGTATALAQALAVVFKAPEGRVWVKLEKLAAYLYAENGVAEHPYPVFVTILHADLPPPEHLSQQALAVSKAVSACLGRQAEHVHVEYSPPGRGRIAFGGKLLQ
jgi:phenylpyruvate tautomerase PptA (4-oxalocrotonate tautomerase family)